MNKQLFTYGGANSRIVVAFLLACLTAPAMATDYSEFEVSAFHYQQKMAELGHPDAFIKLGDMYRDGIGTDRDFDAAEQSYKEAFVKGHDQAASRLKQLDKLRAKAKEDAAKAKAEAAAAAKVEKERVAREKAERERQAREDEDQRKREAAAEAARRAKARAEAERKAEEERLKNDPEYRKKMREAAIRKMEQAEQQSLEEDLAREKAAAERIRMLSTPAAME